MGSLNFGARSLKFCMQVVLDRPKPFLNKKSTKVQKKYISTKVLITQPFFQLQPPAFAWKFIWTVEPNDKVQKYKKYKSTKIQKRKKMQKMQKYKKRKKHKKYKSTKIKKH